MKFVLRRLMPILALAASIAVTQAVDKDKVKFTPPSLDSLETKQTGTGLTIGVVPYNTEGKASAAFGKLNPYQYGVLPILVIMRNDGKEVLSLQGMRAEYIDKSRERIEATPAADVKYSRAPKRPNMNPSPIPGIRFGGKKNPLAAEEIEGRAFAAKMLPPGETAYGFLYFQTGHRTGSRIYITGITQASTGKELFYFDVPLD